MKNLMFLLLGSLCISAATAQSSFNQNTSGTNHYGYRNSAWSFDVSSGASFGIKSNEKSLFRGNSFASKFSGNYQFGLIGLGMSGGLIPGSINDGALNQFLTDRKIIREQSQINSSNPSNAYLLIGPTIHFGERVLVSASAQGGMFMNDPGSLSITANGQQRASYRYDGAGKNIYPGFSGGIKLSYPINGSTNFIINSDYFYSRNTVRLTDIQSGIDIPSEQNRNIQLFSSGIGITKTFATREAGSGMSTGRRKHIGNVKYEEITVTTREAGSGMSTGRRIYQPGQPVYGNITSRDAASGRATGRRSYQPGQPVYGNITSREAGSGMATGRRILTPDNVSSAIPRDAASGRATGRRTYQPGQPVYGNLTSNESCGPVTQKTTYPDGTTEEKTFACPADALAYAKVEGLMGPRMSTNMSVGKQTQGSTFGEKVNQGLQSGANALAQGASRSIIKGRITWGGASSSAYAIVTNTTTRGGSATLNSQSSNTKTTNQSSFGTLVRNGFAANIYAREAGSGIATGKRSREAGSGMATGRRQYQPVYSTTVANVCNPCAVAINTNPLYQGNGQSGVNPMHEGRAQSGPTDADENCDGVAGVNVYLLDASSRATIASTVTESCGEFWFANVPDGDFIIKFSGAVTAGKQFNFSIDKAGNKDIAGEIFSSNDIWSVQYEMIPDTLIKDLTASEIQRIKTKSNIKNDRVASGGTGMMWSPQSNFRSLNVYTGDDDNDGVAETIVGGFVPGAGVVSSAAMRPGGPIGGIIVKGGKNPGGGTLFSTITNEFGEFEFTNLDAGDYFINATQTIFIDDESIISFQSKAFNQNASRSNHTRMAGNSDDQPALQQRAQNNNTVKSNRGTHLSSILIEADLDGDGEYETDISNSHAFTVSVNDEGGVNQPQQKAGISTSRSNIRTRGAAQTLSNDLSILYGTATINGKEVSIKSVLKTKHDTAKNSINNVR